MSRLLKLLVASALSFGIYTPVQAANDGKVYPASVCQWWASAPENVIRKNMVYSQFGRVINKSNTKRLGMVCPIIRDNMSDGGIKRVQIRAIHPNCKGKTEGQECNGNTQCTLRVIDTGGNTIRFNNTRSMVVFDEAPSSDRRFIVSTWNNISVPSNGSTNTPGKGSMYVVFCRISPGTELTSIFIEEND